MGGILALLEYAADVEKRIGLTWPDGQIDDNEEDRKRGRSWYYFVHRNLAESLRGLTA
jgi:hypothetical protein